MKKYIIKRVMLFSILIFVLTKADAQIKNIPEALKTKLVGKTKLPDIMKEVEAYYAKEGKNDKSDFEEGESSYQHWKRWEWWMSSHLDGNGNFIRNISKANNSAVVEMNTRWGSAITAASAQLTQRLANFDREHPDTISPNSPIGIESAYGDWSSIGPTADGTGSGDIKGLGRIDRIAFHPSNSNIIYIGAPSGQLWKTTTGGTSWTPVTDAIGNPGVAGISISPTNGNIVYVLTGDGDSHTPGYLVYDYGSSAQCTGVYKTTDGGTTWNKTGDLYTGASDFEGHHMDISSSNGNYLIAATDQGLYRTTDGGNNWTQVRTGEHWDVKFKPGNDSVVYATTATSILYSTQGGRSGTWLTATTDFSLAASNRINLAVTDANSAYVYALPGNPGTGSHIGIFRSTNSGVSFTRRSNTPNILGKLEDGSDGGDQSGYDLGICVKQNDANFIATCGLNVWVSNGSNGGSSMVWSTKYRESYAGAANKYIHPDVHAVEYNPLNNYLWAGSDGGIYRSTDDGVSWTNMSSGVSTTQFYGMAMQDANADGESDGLNILAGAQDNGMKYRPTAGGSVFGHVICCDGYGSAIAPDNANILYMNINDYFGKSTDGGATYFDLVNPCTFYSPVAIDFNNPDTVYLGGSSTRRSYNGFSTVNANIAINTSRVLSTCPSNTTRLYGSSGSNVIFSADRASTWTTKSGLSGWPVGTFTVNDIEPFPTNSSEVYVCFGGYSAGNKVMRSTNTGDTWTNWSGTLPNVPTYGLCVASEGVYIGTEIGVFFWGYSMTDWVPFYNGMPKVAVTEMSVNANGLIYASTFGRGAWLGTRRSICNSLITVSGVHDGSWYYEASNGANVTLTSPASEENQIFIHSGDTVVLKPGFEVKAGAFFKGYIAPCSNGGLPTAKSSGQNNSGFDVPHIKEIKPKVKLPVQSLDYFQVVEGNIEFNITKKGSLKMMLKQKDSAWAYFYPEDIFYPGFYSLALPETNNSSFKLLLNEREIKEIK